MGAGLSHGYPVHQGESDSCFSMDAADFGVDILQGD